jgi:multicomponent Na+:H+ antiporter subunit G
MEAANDLLTALILVIGAGFAALAGLGVVRMPDVYTRMHAATKAGTLGAGLVLVAVAVHFASVGMALRVLAALFFLILTAPVAAHMIGRAAYRTGVPLWERSVVDQWGLQRPPGAASADPLPPPAEEPTGGNGR